MVPVEGVVEQDLFNSRGQSGSLQQAPALHLPSAAQDIEVAPVSGSRSTSTASAHSEAMLNPIAAMSVKLKRLVIDERIRTIADTIEGMSQFCVICAAVGFLPKGVRMMVTPE